MSILGYHWFAWVMGIIVLTPGFLGFIIMIYYLTIAPYKLIVLYIGKVKRRKMNINDGRH